MPASQIHTFGPWSQHVCHPWLLHMMVWLPAVQLLLQQRREYASQSNTHIWTKVPTCLPSLAPPYDGVATSSAVAAAAKERICQPAKYTHLDHGPNMSAIPGSSI